MTREEEIQKAVQSFCDKVCPCLLVGEYSFIRGAKWADANPKEGLVDLSQVWHNAKEEPEKGKLLIGIDEDDVSIYKWVDQDNNWLSFAKWCGLTRWAYINDLLPKNVGDKSSY